MTTKLMPRAEAFLKLLALEPISKAQLYMVTGWPMDEVDSLLDEGIKAGRVVRMSGNILTHYRIKEAA